MVFEISVKIFFLFLFTEFSTTSCLCTRVYKYIALGLIIIFYEVSIINLLCTFEKDKQKLCHQEKYLLIFNFFVKMSWSSSTVNCSLGLLIF
jgi:hypothetical protein